MSRLFSVFICAWFYAVTAVTPALAGDRKSEAKKPPQIVAEGKGFSISRKHLEREFNEQMGLRTNGFTEAERHLLLRGFLDKLIDRKLLLKAATAKQMIPTDETVKEHLGEAVRSFRKGADFKAELARRGLTEKAFADGLRDDLAIERYLNESVFKTIEVSDDDALAEFKRDPKAFSPAEEVRARQILFNVPEDADAETVESIRLSAETLLADCRKPGADFESLAKKFSQAQNRSNGGDMGYFTEAQLGEFSQKAFTLKVGEVSDLFRSRYGFHIIKVEDRRGGAPEFETAKPLVVATLTRNRQEQLLREHLKRLRNEANVIVYLE